MPRKAEKLTKRTLDALRRRAELKEALDSAAERREVEALRVELAELPTTPSERSAAEEALRAAEAPEERRRLEAELERPVLSEFVADAGQPGLYAWARRGRVEFVFVYRPPTGGSRRRLPIDRYGAITLDQARSIAQRLRGQVVAGIDPKAAREEEARKAEALARYCELLAEWGELTAELRRDGHVVRTAGAVERNPASTVREEIMAELRELERVLKGTPAARVRGEPSPVTDRARSAPVVAAPSRKGGREDQPRPERGGLPGARRAITWDPGAGGSSSLRFFPHPPMNCESTNLSTEPGQPQTPAPGPAVLIASPVTTESTGAVGIRILLRRASPGLRLVRGGHVIDLQIGLEQAGLLQDGVDGVFGEKTELAVQDWQRRRGAEPSGLVDERGRRRPAAGRPGRPRRGGRRRGRRSPGGRVAGGQAKAKLAAGREAFRKELESFRGEVHFGVGRIYDTARLLAPRDFFVELLGSLLTGILVSIRAPYRHDLLRALNRVRSRG